MTPKNYIVSGMILGYGFISFILFVTIETQWKCLLIITYKYASVPILLFSMFLSLKIFPEFFPVKKTSHLWQLVFAITLIMLFFAPSYVSFLNAVLPFQEKAVIQGHIVKKIIKHGKYGKSTLIKLDTENSCARPYRFMVRDDEEFESLKVGGEYEKTVMKGGLGIAYNWLF